MGVRGEFGATDVTFPRLVDDSEARRRSNAME
jgi:hypothetical protein